MSANSFGHILKATSFGESHGPALGVVIDGVPAGLLVDLDFMQLEMARRRPGQSEVVTQRQEADQVDILSGVYEGKTLGTPICAVVYNKDQRSEDYKNLSPRVGHADQAWQNKFGHSDQRGGGRSSGRETLSRVIVGAFAKMLLKAWVPNLSLNAFASQMGPYRLTSEEISLVANGKVTSEDFVTRFPSEINRSEIETLLMEARLQGKSYGGAVRVIVQNPPANLGQPNFHKLKADLALALMSVGATISFELGLGKSMTEQEGSEFFSQPLETLAKDLGGIQGGISTGAPISMEVGFKPTSSVLDVAKKGRHDPCIVPRAVPVVEAMVAWVLADHLLLTRLDRLS